MRISRGLKVRGGKHPGGIRMMPPDLVDKELSAARRAWEAAGNYGALHDALRIPLALGTAASVAVPRWAVEAVARVLRDEVILGVKPRRRGRLAHWRNSYEQDQIDVDRWGTVEGLAGEHIVSWQDAFEAAAEALDGTFAAGSADAVRHSWRKVSKRMKATPERYFECRFLKPALGRRETY
jgi:hypothetical protein